MIFQLVERRQRLRVDLVELALDGVCAAADERGVAAEIVQRLPRPRDGRSLEARAIEQAVAAVVGAGCFVREVRPVRSSLEEVFAELTGSAASSATTGESESETEGASA